VVTDIDELTRLREVDDPRTIAEMKTEDRYDEGVLTEATLSEDGKTWSLGWDSRGCGCPAKDGVEVKVGDTIRIYVDGMSTFHGIDINGVEMFWRTPWERFAERVRWLAAYDREKRERFVREREKLDATYAALSEPMKGRIDRFRGERADFRIESEGYEIFACSQADVFAARARVAADAQEGTHEVDAWFGDGSFEREHPRQAERPASELTPAVRWLLWWSNLPYERQRELMPGMDDGHSGNTFGAAWYYAVRLLLGEDV
jgi:hypothetical protein